MKLVSRSAWGARAWRNPNGGIQYSGSRRGAKFHYLGTPYTDRAHANCAAYIRSLQNSHMNGNGWSDIGYSFLVCTHGYVYEGRGLRRRNSANGSTTLNNKDYAICLLVGSSGVTQPTTAQLHGARDALEYVRRSGPCGTWVGGHQTDYATACPGAPIMAWVKKGCPRPNTDSPEDDMPDFLSLGSDKAVSLPRGKWISPAFNIEWSDGASLHAAGASRMGPGFSYTGFVHVRLSGMTPGKEVQVRIVEDDLNGKHKGNFPIGEGIGTAGDTFFTMPITGKCAKNERIRVEIAQFGDSTATLKRVEFKAQCWKL